MRSVSSSYARDNWSRVMDEAIREPLAVTSHGRARVIIVDAALSEQVAGAVADAGPRVPAPPAHPWLDKSLPMNERIDALVERKREITAKSYLEWTDEEHAIIAQNIYGLD